MVGKLINPNSGNWDGGRVDNLLNDRDKNHILQLNPSSGYPDTWNWPGDLRNIYIVKAGYRALCGNAKTISEITLI